MLPHVWPSVALVGTLGYLVAMTYLGSWRPQSLAEFFHHDDPTLNTTSLVATNVTAAGLGYLLISGHTNGLLMAASPLALLAGYRLLGRFTNILPESFTNAGNFFAAASTGIQKELGGQSIFAWSVSLPLILIYTLLLAYELFTASQLLSGLISSDASSESQFAIAVGIFFATLAYCYLSGVRAVLKTNRLQFYVILTFIAVLLSIAIAPIGVGERHVDWLMLLKLDGQTFLNVGLAMLAALNTQFYSIINSAYISHLPMQVHRDRVITKSANILTLLFAVIIFTGAITPENWSAGLGKGMAALITPLEGHLLGAAVLTLAVVGLTCVTASTVDTLQITLTQFLYDNVLMKNTKDSSVSPIEVKKARLAMGCVMTAAFTALSAMYFTRPDVFYLLLAIVSPAETTVPLIVLIGFLARREGGLGRVTNGVLLAFFCLFLSAMGFNIYSAVKAPLAVPMISLVHFALSTALATGIYFCSNRYGPLGQSTQ